MAGRDFTGRRLRNVPASLVGQTCQPSGPTGDWKVPRTSRLESLPYGAEGASPPSPEGPGKVIGSSCMNFVRLSIPFEVGFVL